MGTYIKKRVRIPVPSAEGRLFIRLLVRPKTLRPLVALGGKARLTIPAEVTCSSPLFALKLQSRNDSKDPEHGREGNRGFRNSAHRDFLQYHRRNRKHPG